VVVMVGGGSGSGREVNNTDDGEPTEIYYY